MPKKYIPNDTDRTIFVGGVMIAPGEGREVDTAFLPPEHQEPAAETLADDGPGDDDADANLRDMLKGGVRDIEPLLPELSSETLKRLAELEGERDTPRKGVLGPIQELLLKRAGESTGAPT